jgi:MATE family multidrug resistance protein
MTPPHPIRFREEFAATARLAGPLAAAQVAQIGMGVTDTVLLGALGRDAIAVGGMGAGLYFTLVAVLQGLGVSVGILVAHARGAGEDWRIARIFRAGLVLGALAALPLMLFMWRIEPFLLFIGEPTDLARGVAAYDSVLLAAAPASMWLGVQRAYLAAVNHPRIVMAVSIAALIVNGFLNYGLIHGVWGLPEMGVQGSCTATAITQWAAMAAMGVGVRAVSKEHGFLGRIEWPLVRDLFDLGWPIVATRGVEIILFLVAALMMGILGTTAMAAHQVTINVAAMTFMVPLATSQAANVRVGFHFGMGMAESARRAAIAAFTLGVGFMAVMAVILFVAPREIALLFNLDPSVPGDAEVIALASELLWICAFFQVFDGAQTIAAGALAGMKDTRVPMVLAGLGYWAVGFPVAWVFGFTLGAGPRGIWWGLAVGLAVVAVVLCWRLWHQFSKRN